MMRMRTLITTAALLLLLMATTGCLPDDPPPSRQEVLVSATDHLIVPRIREVAQEMSALQKSLNSLCDGPAKQRLDEARDAWRKARAPWMRSQAMWFGPVMERRSRSYVDWAPIEPERIENMLDKRESVDAEYVKEYLASTQRGLAAVEYVLFDSDDVVLGELSQSNSIRCQYLVALGDVVSDETAGVLADWIGDNQGEDSYSTYFNGTADSSLIGKAALNELVRTSVFLSRTITDMRLGKAIGVDGVTADSAALLSGNGHNGVADIRNQVLGMRDVYLGGDGEGALGVSALVQGLSKETDDRMREAFEDAIAAVDGLEEPLVTTIQSDPQAALKAHDALKQMQLTLSTDIVSLLDVTVGFADTDGDGG